MKTEKKIPKGVSLLPSQLEKIGEIIDLNQYGEFSQFASEAIMEKAERIIQQSKQNELKAS